MVMREHILSILLMIYCVGCSSSRSDVEDEYVYDSTEVMVYSEIGVDNEAWEKADEIGIFMTYSNMPMVISDTYNIRYSTTEGDGIFSPVDEDDAIEYPQSVIPVDMYAYHPYTSGVSDDGVVDLNLSSFHQRYSQSSLDLLVASSKYIEFEERDESVVFSFDHKMTKLLLFVYPGDGLTIDELSSLTVEISDQHTVAECNIFSGEITASGSVSSIEFNTTVDDSKCEAIVLLLPQTTSRDCKLTFSISENDSFDYSISDIEMSEGENRIYNFSLNHKGVEQISTAIDGWDDSDQSGAVISYTAIRSEADLITLREGVNSGTTSDVNVILMADITLSSSTWSPIGTSTYPFTGIFDGNGKSISGLTINSPNSSNQGLFGVAGDGVSETYIGRLTINSPSVTGGSNCGALAGMVMNATIINCTTDGGSVVGVDYVGGIVGLAVSSVLTSCTNSSTVSGEGSCVSDIAGYLRSSTLIEE